MMDVDFGGADDVDLDALLDEEEEIMAEMQQAQEEEKSRKRKAEEVDHQPRKQRKSVAVQDDGVLVDDTVADALESDKENELQPLVIADTFATSASTGQDDPQSVADGPQEEEEEEEDVPVAEKSVVMTQRPDATTDYVTVCGEDGSRFYLNMHSEEELDAQSDSLWTTSRQRFGKLTDENFDEIIEKAKAERERWERSEAGMPSVAGTAPGELWVDKYGPRGYTDLLSEEYVNRALLTWLKAWDGLVFGRQRPRRPSSARPVPSTAPAPFMPPTLTPDVETDELGRPAQKVALLCGPPGLGKTTLAHIAARHCGYTVVEVNASDDRSAGTFRQRLEAAANTKYALGSDQRPVCLVLDEVDGAPEQAVAVLVAACKARPGGRRQTRGRGTDAASGVPPVMRPLICVCNDPYVPALRQLRPLAFVVRFPPPQVSRLAARLLNVIQQEEMRADLSVLSALADRSEKDIRSCLNTLQFIRGRGHKEITAGLLRTLNMGHKDVQKGLFAAWNQIFSLPRPNAGTKSSAGAGSGPMQSALSVRAEEILRTVGRSSGGDWLRLVDGLYETFLEMRFKDAYMTKVCDGLDWLCFADTVSCVVGKTQNFSLRRYQPYLAVFFHLNFAGVSGPRPMWPQAAPAAVAARTRSEEVVAALASAAAASCRTGRRALLLEVLPPLADLVQPALRPVNAQLYSPRERQEMQRLVATLLQFGLELRQERGPDGQYDYLLEPDLQLVSRFPGARQVRGMSYAAKQLVARELALERLRRQEGGAEGGASKGGTAAKRPPALRQAWSIREQVRQVKAVSATERSRDFFGRPVAPHAPMAAKSDGDGEAVRSPLNDKIWFRFKEGYSNAIRRPVRVRELL